MTKYLIEETLTAQSAAGIMQKPEDRSKVLRPIFDTAGCKLEQFYISAIENNRDGLYGSLYHVDLYADGTR